MKKSRMKQLSNSQNCSELSFSLLLARCAIFSLIFYAVFFLMGLLFSAMFFNTQDPLSMVNASSVITSYVSIFTCSFILSRLNGQKYVLSGLILGMIIFTTLMLISLISNEISDKNNFVYKSFIPPISILGSVIGIKRDKTKRRKHKRLRSYQ